MSRKQVRTRRVSTHSIIASSEFARGLEDVRAGRPFNADNGSWDYERGRAFGFIAPLDIPLRIGRKLNPKALKLADAACEALAPPDDAADDADDGDDQDDGGEDSGEAEDPESAAILDGTPPKVPPPAPIPPPT